MKYMLPCEEFPMLSRHISYFRVNSHELHGLSVKNYGRDCPEMPTVALAMDGPILISRRLIRISVELE